MSHYSLAVIFESKKFKSNTTEEILEEIMEPFREKSVPKYVEYTKEQLIQKSKERIEQYKNGLYAEYLKDPEKYIASCDNYQHIKYISEEFPRQLEWSDEEIYQYEIRYYEKEDIGLDGEVYSTYNPLSKWDWYEVGGRFLCPLPINLDKIPAKNIEDYLGYEDYEELTEINKDKYTFVSEAYVSDISLNKPATQVEIEKCTESWNKTLAGEGYYKPEYFKERYGTLENYINECTKFSTYAVLTPDGKWHEPGKILSFGMSSASDEEEKSFKDNYYDNFIKPYCSEDYYMVIVDCHI